MKKIYINIILFLLLIITGCANDQVATNNINEAETQQSMVVENKPCLANFEINEKKFDEGFQVLRNWLYFDENSDKDKYLIEEKVAVEEISLSSAQKLPESLISPIGSSGNDEKVCILDEQTIYSYDLKTLELEEIMSLSSKEDIISQCCISGNNLFYKTENYSEGEDKPQWNIWVMNLETGERLEIDNSKNYEEVSLIPILKVSDGKLTYLVGEEKMDGLRHYVYLYHDGVNEVIFEVQNVVIEYLSPYIDEKVLAIPDYFTDGWYLMIYEMDTKDVRYVKMPFLTEGEFPYTFFVADAQIIYSSCYSVIYLKEENSDGFEIIHDNGGGLHDCSVLFESDLYFIDGFDLWHFDLLEKKKEVLYDTELLSEKMKCRAIWKGDTDVYLVLHDSEYKIHIMILDKTNEETSAEIPAIGGSDYTFLRKYIDEVYNIQLASEIVGKEARDEWVNNVFLKKSAEEQEAIPPIYQIIVDLEISKEDLIQKNNENGGIYLSAETIDALYQEDIEEVKKALMSPLALYHEGEIYTYDEFAETYVEADIPAETLDEYFDYIETVCEQEGILKYMWESIDNTRKAYGLE